MLTLYVDFKSSAAYLAIRPTLAMASRFGIAIEWRPFRTVERDVPKLGKEETVGESHRRVRAASQRALASKYASHQGLKLQFPERTGNTDLALGVLAQLECDPLPFIQVAFEAYWADHADLNDDKIVQRIIATSGVQYSGDLAAARDLLAVVQDQAEEAGIVGAPAYVIKDQIFVGREHLPWIETLVRDEN